MVGNWDTDISNAVRQETTSHILKYSMEGVALAGDVRGGMAINLGVFFFGGTEEAGNAKLATASWGVCGLVTTLVKGVVNRDRPDHSSTSRWDSSFPSDHTSTYFALATVYAHKYPKWAIPLYAVGAGVAYSRVLLGEHYPTDVLAGAALGYGIGWLTLKFEPELRKIPFLR